jgi:hypothetical protein
VILSEDHFSELAEEELDSQGLPIEKRDVERAIRRYIKLIRCEDTPDQDPDKKRKLILRLCQLKIRLNQMNEELDEKYLNGHRLNRPGSNGSITDLTGSSSSSVMACDVCLKKQNMIMLPSGLFKTYQPNVLLVCDFCEFKIHRNCTSHPQDSHIRTCPQTLFQEEEDTEEEERQQRLGQESPSLNSVGGEDTQNSETSTPVNPRVDNYTSFGANIRYSRYVEFSICPEVGLSKQGFKCADCESSIVLNTSRLCDYDGLYYCFKCHWNDLEKTPARILHNWDPTPKPVSRRSLQMICYIKKKPVLFDVLNFNPMLYGLVEDLPLIKRLRLELSQMVQYIRLCRQPGKPRITCASYFFNEEESNGGNALSFSDLINLEGVKKNLLELHGQLLTHITTECEGCRGKGFFCDHCRDRTDLLFPFSANISACPDCGTVYHRNCYHRKGKTCIRCLRRSEKKIQVQGKSQEEQTENKDHNSTESISSDNAESVSSFSKKEVSVSERH